MGGELEGSSHQEPWVCGRKQCRVCEFGEQKSRIQVESLGGKQEKSTYRYQEDYISIDVAIKRTLAGIVNQKGKHKRFQDSGETWPNLLKKNHSS